MNFSIITASYNSMPFISHCLNSLRAQQGVIYEHILIDGDSSDGTKEFLQAEKGIRLVSEKDQGVYDALNKGLSLSVNQIIGILHTDDFFADENVLKDIQELFLEGADIVYADLDYVSRLKPELVIRRWRSGVFTPTKLLLGWMPPHPTFFIKRDVLDKVGGYNLKYKISSDYDFMLRALEEKTFKVSYLRRTIVKMRVGGVSNKSLENLKLKLKEDFDVASGRFFVPCATIFFKNIRKISQFF